jgi:hypothetical protein
MQWHTVKHFLLRETRIGILFIVIVPERSISSRFQKAYHWVLSQSGRLDGCFLAGRSDLAPVQGLSDVDELRDIARAKMGRMGYFPACWMNPSCHTVSTVIALHRFAGGGGLPPQGDTPHIHAHLLVYMAVQNSLSWEMAVGC